MVSGPILRGLGEQACNRGDYTLIAPNALPPGAIDAGANRCQERIHGGRAHILECRSA